MSKKNLSLLAGAVLMLALLVLFNAVLSSRLSGARIDLTADGLYTLSPGVGEFLRGFDEPVSMELYVSRGALEGLPQYRSYAQRVQEFLEELVRRSEGKLTLAVRDPEPFSEAEDAAQSAGLASVPTDGMGNALTLGLVLTNAADRREAVPFLDPSQEPTLEYDVIRALATLRSGEKPKVGVLTSLPMAGSGSQGMMMQQPTQPWVAYRQMRAFHEVIDIDPSAEQLPDALDALVIAHPENLNESMLRSIDRYVVGGGKLLLFYDGFCEAAASQGNPMMGMMGSPAAPSSMGPMPGAWGVELAMGKFAADVKLAPRVPAGPSQQGATLPYLALMDLREDQLDRESLITRSISRLIVATPGALQLTDKPGLVAQTLIHTTDGGSTLDTGLVSVMPSPASLLQSFRPGDATIPLMVRLTGTFPSAYASDTEEAPQTPENQGETQTPATQPEAIDEQAPIESRPGEVLIVSDADFLQDAYGLQNAGPFGFQPIADNGNLVLNALELLTGDPVLASLKPRGRYQRPFEVVERLRRDAEARFLSRQQELENDIRQTEQKLTELQRVKPDEQLAVLTPQQQQEIDRLQEQVLSARSELRQVRYDLNREIDSLGQKLRVLNVVLWPALVFSIAMLWWAGRMVTGGRRKN